MKKDFDLISLGEIMLRLSPPDNERITRGDTLSKQAEIGRASCRERV